MQSVSTKSILTVVVHFLSKFPGALHGVLNLQKVFKQRINFPRKAFHLLDPHNLHRVSGVHLFSPTLQTRLKILELRHDISVAIPFAAVIFEMLRVDREDESKFEVAVFNNLRIFSTGGKMNGTGYLLANAYQSKMGEWLWRT